MNELTHAVIGMAIEVHRELGPGLLESAYEECLAHELRQSTVKFARQKPVPVTYKGLELDCGYRIDLLVEDQLVIELKSVEELIPLFDAQILTYMKLADKSIGLLINFNVPVLKTGAQKVCPLISVPSVSLW